MKSRLVDKVKKCTAELYGIIDNETPELDKKHLEYLLEKNRYFCMYQQEVDLLTL